MGWNVYRTPIDQHLHTAGVNTRHTVHRYHRAVATFVSDHHPRHQTEKIGNGPGSRGFYHLPVNDSHRHRCFTQGLCQAGGGQHDRHLAQIILFRQKRSHRLFRGCKGMATSRRKNQQPARHGQNLHTHRAHLAALFAIPATEDRRCSASQGAVGSVEIAFSQG